MQMGYDRSFIYGEKTPPDILAEYNEEFGRFYKAILRNLKVDLDESGKEPVMEFLAWHFEYALDHIVDCGYDEDFIKLIYYERNRNWVNRKATQVMWLIVNGVFMHMTDAELDNLMKQEQWDTITEGTGIETAAVWQ